MLVQILQELSPDLAVSVLMLLPAGTCHLLLRLLPQHMHHHLLHPILPQLFSECTLMLDCQRVPLSLSTAALSSFASLNAEGPHSKFMNLSNVYLHPEGPSQRAMNAREQAQAAFQAAVHSARPSQPVHVQLPGVDYRRSGTCILHSLAGLTTLRSLSTDMMRSDRKTVASVGSLTNLTSLQLSPAVGPQCLSQCVSLLVHLKSLSAKLWHPSNLFACAAYAGSPFPDAAADSLAAALSRLTQLTLLHLQQTCSHQHALPGDAAWWTPRLIRRNLMTDKQMRALISALRRMSQLADVCLPITSATQATINFLDTLATACQCTRLQTQACNCTSFRD